MSRNCSAAASAGPTLCQLRPPVGIRSTVPAVPATHATDALTAASPRNRTVTPVGDSDHAGVPFPRPAVKPPVVASTIRPTAAIDNLRSDLMPGTYAARRGAATAVRRVRTVRGPTGQFTIAPQLRLRVVAVIAPAASEARNTAVPATSDSRGRRPSAVWSTMN